MHITMGIMRGLWCSVRLVCLAGLAVALTACAGLPPGAKAPRSASTRLARPESTALGGQMAAAAKAHHSYSGFRIITPGLDGLLVRVQMIDAAERTLDLQYFIFRGDTTGRLITAALQRAADRGVRVRVLVDDSDTVPGDEQLLFLDGHPNMEVRVFNPFVYRGHANSLRAVEFLFNARRLDYRMHNKLLVVDDAVALVGGRNIGDQYFQIDPESQFADDDVFVAGPVADELAATFDEYWNSPLAIPAAVLGGSRTQPEVATAPNDFAAKIAAGEPYAGITSGRLPLVWAHAQVVCDSPDKKAIKNGEQAGRMMGAAVLSAAGATQTELLMVTPYFIPTPGELQVLRDLRQRQVRVRILTNSMEANPVAFAQSGYVPFRVPMLQGGVELYEARARLGNTQGSGQTAEISRHGNYALHAKLFVFDRQRLFIGSMNFDKRSKNINTEVGLIIDSPELAAQTAARFAAMVQPQNAYQVALRAPAAGPAPQLYWRTEEAGWSIDYLSEPARSTWQRVAVQSMSLLPVGDEQ
jgi:putative cardiolipin synthase